MKLKVTGLSGIQFGTRAIINKAGSLVTLKWVSALTNESTLILHFCRCMQNNCVLFNNFRKVEAWHMQLAHSFT